MLNRKWWMVSFILYVEKMDVAKQQVSTLPRGPGNIREPEFTIKVERRIVCSYLCIRPIFRVFMFQPLGGQTFQNQQSACLLSTHPVAFCGGWICTFTEWCNQGAKVREIAQFHFLCPAPFVNPVGNAALDIRPTLIKRQSSTVHLLSICNLLHRNYAQGISWDVSGMNTLEGEWKMINIHWLVICSKPTHMLHKWTFVKTSSR